MDRHGSDIHAMLAEKNHDRFGHPSSNALINLLQRARPQVGNAQTQRGIQGLARSCCANHYYASKPVYFRVFMPQGEILFYHRTEMDLFSIDGKAALHIINREIRYSEDHFLRQ